jgi:nitrous oxidase accessory protein NosD
MRLVAFAIVSTAALISLTQPAVTLAEDDNGDDNGDGVLLVDRDEVQCPDADFNSIQAAVGAAPPGATIAVCPDRYNEDVDVPKTLTLRAVSAFDDDDDGDDDFDDGQPNCFSSSSIADPTRQAIVDGAVFAFNLDADDVVLQGFVVEDNDIGIMTAAEFSGYRIEHNLVQDNGVGLSFESNGARHSLVSSNCFRSTSPTAPVSETAAGILSTGDLSNATITDNSFLRHFVAGIVLTHVQGPPFTNIAITGNRSLEDVCAISIQGSRSSRIDGNLSVRNGFAGIFVASDNQHLAIRSNVLREGEHGIDFDSFNFNNGNLAPNLFVQASGNRISDMDRSGIAVSESPLGSLQQSVISQNSSKNNDEDGIRIEGCTPTGSGPPCPTPNINNLIFANVMSGNAEHDCHDDTIGTGTAGTGNIWRDNQGVTENRPGLCEPGDDNGD